jgi:flagellar hook-associated protein 3 FlgL
MSILPAAATDFGTLDQAVSATSLIQRNLAALSAETSSGYVAPNFAGLGQGAASALDLSDQLANNTALQNNATFGGNIQQVAQTALGQIESIASSFAGQATSLESTPSAAPTVAASAQDALRQVAGLLDTQVGGIYVFGGQGSTTPPVPDPDTITTSAFYTAIQTAVANLTTNGAAATSAANLVTASPGGTSPFDPTLEASGAQSSVDVGNGVQVALAPLANTNSNATSTGVGTTSTGSYTRDILLGLASLATLGGVSPSDPNFLPFVQSTVTTFQGAVTAANADIGALGDRQAQLTTAQTNLSDTATAVKTQLSSLQDADLPQVAAQLASVQTQLQASYQVIAALSQLSLAKFLPAA